MAPEKETMMMLKVDLNCARCYKKIKKLLCSLEQVKDQSFDKKQNTIKIKVVGHCPERIKNKIWCKGGKTIQDIQIMDPPKPKKDEKKDEPQTPKKDEKKDESQTPPQPPPKKTCCSDCREGRTTGPCYTGCGYRYGYGVPPPPPPPPPPCGWVYYDGCPPCGYEYRPSGHYYINYDYPSACVIM